MPPDRTRADRSGPDTTPGRQMSGSLARSADMQTLTHNADSAGEGRDIGELLAEAASHPAYNRGWVSVADIAGQCQVSRQEFLRHLAELLSEGCVRATFGKVPGQYLGRLLLTDGDDQVHLLIHAPPDWQPLPDNRKKHLLRIVDDDPDISIGAVALMHAGLRIGHPGDGHLSFNSDELEDYLGARRGSIAGD